MGANSKIEWTDHTFNPWIGCEKVSAGCKNCYAEKLMDNRLGVSQWGRNGTRPRTSDTNWNKPRQWARQAAAEGVRRRVFCASLADVFEDRWDLLTRRLDLFALIQETPELDWLLLTKRPENIKPLVGAACAEAMQAGRVKVAEMLCAWVSEEPPANVWLGTSVEDQEAADKRILPLLDAPAVCRFLSMEPLLGPVDLMRVNYLSTKTPSGRYPFPNLEEKYRTKLLHILDWVIVGGESGHGARPMEAEWVRDIHAQCLEARVPFFFKQWGEWAPTGGLVGGSQGVMPEHLKVGKAKAGRLLDGREWNEFPEVAK